MIGLSERTRLGIENNNRRKRNSKGGSEKGRGILIGEGGEGGSEGKKEGRADAEETQRKDTPARVAHC